MNAFTYILTFLVVGGFADVDSEISEQSNKLQQLLSEISKSNLSLSPNISYHLTDLENRLRSNPVVILVNDPSVRKLDSECVRNRDCHHVLYSECSQGICSCRPNYFAENDKCVGYLGAACEDDSDCGISDSICQSGICECRSDFNSTVNRMCLLNATGLNGICKSDEGCKNIPYSSCSNSRCLCLSNYKESSGKCLGSIDAMCNNSSDCVAPNAICNGTCQCPSNFYFEDNKCYRFAKQLLIRVHSAQACQRLPNSAFINGRCMCSPDYYFEDDHCNNQIPSDYGTPVASAKACKFLEDAVYLEGKCYKKKKLHESCDLDHLCTVNFSECSNRECKCKDKYYEHDNRCYASWHEKCNTPEDCFSIWLDCDSGTCEGFQSLREGVLSYKPGATARWNEYKYYYNEWDIRHYFYSNTYDRRVYPRENLAWVKNYTLDRVASVNWLDKLIIWCRAKNSTGQFVPGEIDIEENNKLCRVDHRDQKFSTEDYEVYVDLGPE